MAYKTIIFAAFALFLSTSTALAQDAPAQRPSPASSTTQQLKKAKVSINYGSPSVKGRKIWGDLVPFGQVWRTGANEATTFEVDKDVKVQGQLLKAGKYALFTIPGENEWTIIFNKTAKQWGAYKYDQKEDALRVTAKPKKSAAFSEKMTFAISKKGVVSLNWENLQVDFKVK